MVLVMPAWKKPFCWVRSARKGRRISQWPGAQRAHFGADQAHHALPGEAAANIRLPVGIARLEGFLAGRAVWGMSRLLQTVAHRS
jgi:hypothetical protein